MSTRVQPRRTGPEARLMREGRGAFAYVSDCSLQDPCAVRTRNPAGDPLAARTRRTARRTPAPCNACPKDRYARAVGEASSRSEPRRPNDRRVRFACTYASATGTSAVVPVGAAARVGEPALPEPGSALAARANPRTGPRRGRRRLKGGIREASDEEPVDEGDYRVLDGRTESPDLVPPSGRIRRT